MIRFLARLVRDAGSKVFLVLDRLAVHRSPGQAVVGQARGGHAVFTCRHTARNSTPDEGLNGDLKQALTERSARSKHSSSAASIGHMPSCRSHPRGP